jgi:uncharacterized protein
MDKTLKRWLCLLPAMAFPSIAAYAYFDLAHNSGAIQGLYVFEKGLALFWPILAQAWILGEPPVLQGRRLSTDLRALPLGAALGLLAGLGIVLAYTYSTLGPLVDLSAPVIKAKMSQAGILDHMVPFVIVLSTLHSALEEYQWRWFVYGNLKKLLPPFWANMAGAWSFAAHHFIILFYFFPPLPALFFGLAVVVAGLVWQWMLETQKSLAGSWLAHALVDGAIFVVALKILGH